MHRNTRNLLAGIAVTAALAMGAIAAPVEAATLRMAWSQDATGLDPHKQTAFSSLRLLELVYEGLVRLDPQYNVIPAIAKSWEFSPDGLTLTFKLDPAAKFSTGAQVTSDDVKASFTRILDEATAAAARANFTSISSIDTPDAGTVVFHLSQPDAPILVAMSTTNASIAPASSIADGSIATKPIGSGPFKLDEWDPNVKDVLSANANWAGGKTGVDGIVISVLPSESAIVDSMRANQTDFALFNDPTVATLIPGEQGMTLNRIPGLAYNVLQLNPSRPPMDNEKVRQAISCAVNRQEIIDTALVGEGKVTGPLTMAAYADDPSTLFCYKQDVDKAKQLMKDAGQEAGFSVDVIAATGEPPYAANEAQVLQSQLAAIGVKLNIKTMDLKPYVDTWLKGDFDMAVAQNGGRPDPYPMYNRYFTKGGNLAKVSNYVDDQLDSLLQQGRAETDIAKRKVIFQQFEQHLAEASPWVWISSTVTYVANLNAVKGYDINPSGIMYALSKVTVGQ